MSYKVPALKQLVARATQALTLAEVKLYLRVDGTAEDAFITELIDAATEMFECYTRCSLLTQTWQQAYDEYMPCKVALSRGPVQAINQVRVVAQDGTITIIPNTDYTLNAGNEFLNTSSEICGHIVQVEYVAGFGGSTTDIPADIKQGLLSHIALMFEERINCIGMPRSVTGIYSKYKKVRL